jgi:2-oxoglutarate dehydrogenase complex dehydrogenase (E1) component-like enzyme
MPYQFYGTKHKIKGDLATWIKVFRAYHQADFPAERSDGQAFNRYLRRLTVSLASVSESSVTDKEVQKEIYFRSRTYNEILAKDDWPMGTDAEMFTLLDYLIEHIPSYVFSEIVRQGRQKIT